MQYENNKKGLKKQLFAAILMLLVAALALGTSTYAWFVNSKTVTGDGMTVNATADSSLQILGSDKDEVWGTTGTSTLTSQSMKPCTSSNGSDFGCLGANVVVESETLSDATWSGNSGAFNDGDITTATNSTDPAITYTENVTYKLKAVGEDAKIYVSGINVAGSSKAIYDSLRVAVTITDSTTKAVTKIYKPASGAKNNDGKVGSKSSGGKWTLVTDGSGEGETSIYTGTTAADIWSLTKDTEYTATVTIWFEGQDTACKSANVTTTDATITINFKKN